MGEKDQGWKGCTKLKQDAIGRKSGQFLQTISKEVGWRY